MTRLPQGHGTRHGESGGTNRSVATTDAEAAAGRRRGFLGGCGGDTGRAPCGPGGDLGVDVARRGHDRRATLQLTSGLVHPAVEVLQHRAHVGLTAEQVELGVQPLVLGSQQDRGRPRPVRFSVSILRRIHQSGSWCVPSPSSGLPAPGRSSKSPRRIATWIAVSMNAALSTAAAIPGGVPPSSSSAPCCCARYRAAASRGSVMMHLRGIRFPPPYDGGETSAPAGAPAATSISISISTSTSTSTSTGERDVGASP